MKNIPLPKLLISELWAFFKQYGVITNVTLEKSKSAATVFFKEIISAESASQATSVMQIPKIEIIYNVGQKQSEEEIKKAKELELEKKEAMR